MGLEIPSMSQTCCFVLCGHWGETKNRSAFAGAGGCRVPERSGRAMLRERWPHWPGGVPAAPVGLPDG